jgi:hypothetical protein
VELKPKSNCPLNNFEPCKQLDCAWFMEVHGTHPNTGEQIKDWGCAVTWLPVMLIENGRQQKSTASAIESFRNEMMKSNQEGQQALLAAAGFTTPPQVVLGTDKG